MSLLSGLLDGGARQPAACVVKVGQSETDLGFIARMASAIEINLDRNEAATGTMTFEDRREPDGNWTVADSGLFARWQPVKVLADFGSYSEEVFRGFIKSLKPNYPPNGGEATFEVQLQDQSALLDRDHMRRVWGERAPESDRTILETLVRPASLRVDPQSGQGRSSRSLSQDGTAIRFLRDRAKANGYELIFDEGRVYFGPPQLSGAPMPPLTLYAGRRTNCLSFSVEDDALKPDEVRFDAAPATDGAEPDTQTIRPNAPKLGRTATSAEGADLPTPFVWRLSREGDESATDMRARAQALANDNAMKLKASGEADGSRYGHVLKPGRVVTVDGAGTRYGGAYYIDKVVHQFTPDGYRQRFELKRNAVGEQPGGAVGGVASALAGLFG
jgi:hypothetical protein